MLVKFHTSTSAQRNFPVAILLLREV